MLLSFRFANHKSIKDEQQLSLTQIYEADRPEGTDWSAVPVAALFGANAAGKSNVVDALRFMTETVIYSHLRAEPWDETSPLKVPVDGYRAPFLLDQKSATEPSWFVADLLLDEVRYTYGFSVNAHQVLDEWLHSYPHGRRRVVFERSADEYHFGDTAPKKDLTLVTSITEPSVLFISVAARSRQDTVRPVYNWFRDLVEFRSGGPRAHLVPSRRLVQMLDHPEQSAPVIQLLQAADVGIENVGVEITADPGGQGRQRAEVWFDQRGRSGNVRLRLPDQSDGTQALLAYAVPVLRTLGAGGLLVVDEIDSSLHPNLTAHLIRLFQRPETNPSGAQLILTTHDVSLLGRRGGEDILRRDQIWFAEKNEYGETTLFPLSDFKPRPEENRERRYLGGSYGAVPFLSDDRFEGAVMDRVSRAAEG